MKTSENNASTQPVNENITSGENSSVWFDAVNHPISYETLKNDIDTDILVIAEGYLALLQLIVLQKKDEK